MIILVFISKLIFIQFCVKITIIIVFTKNYVSRGLHITSFMCPPTDITNLSVSASYAACRCCNADRCSHGDGEPS